MRGMFFSKPFEYRLETEGEAWSQGQTLRGRLEIRPSAEGAERVVGLARGSLKAVRAKAPDAFEQIEQQATDSNGRFEFQLSPNAIVTDVSTSLYLRYGAQGGGVLQISVSPHDVVQRLLKTLEISFRFVTKSSKSKKDGWVENSLAPPDGKSHARLEGLKLLTRLGEGLELETQWVFELQTLEATASSITTKKSKKTLQKTLARERYRHVSGRLDPDVFDAFCAESLREGMEAV